MSNTAMTSLLLNWTLLSGKKLPEMEEAVCENHCHTVLGV